MHSRPRIFIALGYLAGLTAFGALGFMLLEGLNWADALYLSVITISTVGFGDITPATQAGRFFTIGLVTTGVGTALYLISLIAQEILEGRLRDFFQRSSMMREIRKHNGHVIVCGYGRFGRVVVGELMRVGRAVVVIDEDATLENDLASQGVDYIIASAVDDEVLIAAGIKRANTIVVGTSVDATSVFITLSARELNADIRIHARGESESAVRRLKRAGADYVNSPYQMGGLRTATSILSPSVVDFFDLSRPNSTTEIDLEEIRTDAGCEIVGASVGEIEEKFSQVRIIALKHSDESFELVPVSSATIKAGDHLVVIGEREQLLGIAQLALCSETT